MNPVFSGMEAGRRKIPGVRAGGFSSAAFALLLAAVSWSLAFSLACRLAGGRIPDARDRLLADVAGNIRFALGGRFIVEADRWFHKGVGHFRKRAFDNWFTRTFDAVRPTTHIHLEGEKVEEIIPWLYFAARLDPSNIEAYSVAAFFLAVETGRPDLADKVLRDAQRRNPGDYRVFHERGRLALRTGRLDDAARFFSGAIRMWPGVLEPDDAEARNDMASMLAYRALLYEIEGNPGEAMRLYDEVLKLFPGRLGIEERLKQLKSSGRAASAPMDVLRMMRLHHPWVCEHDGHEH